MDKKKEIFRVKEVKIPIYGGKITVIIFLNTWKKVISHLKRKGFDTRGYEDQESGYCGLQTSQYVNGVKKFAIIIKDDKDVGDTLVHELFHLTQDILEYRGINFVKEDANEAYAYLIGYLFTKVEKLLK